jgi:hypothetical protein
MKMAMWLFGFKNKQRKSHVVRPKAKMTGNSVPLAATNAFRREIDVPADP